MHLSPRTHRFSSRFVTGLMAASLALGAFGATGASASVALPSTSMILHGVPPEDLLANTQGICNGSFNLVIRNVLGVTNTLAYLDAAQRCGLKAIVFFQSTVNGGTVYPSNVAPLVNAVKHHPALFGYLSVKEPSWVGISATEIRSLYSAFHAADPTHPVVGLFGDIPHFGDKVNPYTAGMADVVMVDWYPVETASKGCSRTGSTYVYYGWKWYSTKVVPKVKAATPNVPIWVMVQTHKYLAPSCHKKQRPSWDQMVRQVREALVFAGATGIAFHTFSNTSYSKDQKRDPGMMINMKSIAARVRAGTLY